MNQPLESRIQAVLDGTIGEQDFRHLEDELAANPDARKLYYQYVALHQGLEYRLSRGNGHLGMSGLADARLDRQRAKTRKLAILTAAAVLILGLVTMQMFFIQRDNPSRVADIEVSPGTLFTMTHKDGSEASGTLQMAPESRLQVSQGSVELTFPSGVRAIVQGPADMTLHDLGKLYMDTGTGWFHVPEGAEGFTVKTRELNIIDLGTEFGVISDPDQDDEVHVFKGKVRVEALHGVKKETTLATGKAVNVRPYGRFQSKALKPGHFLTQLPKTLPHMHWSFDDSEELLTKNTIRSADSMGYQLHSTSNTSRSIHYKQGMFGGALSLDGIGSYLESDWPGILGNAPRTVAFWLKMPELRSSEDNQINQLGIISWGTQQGGHNINNSINSKWTLHFDPTTGRYPMFNISFGGFWYYAPETVLDDDQWHHVTVTYNGKSDDLGYPVVKIFVDGKPRTIRHAHSGGLPLRTHEDGQVIIDTLENTPFVIGALPSHEASKLVRPSQFIRAQIDELYIIEGVIDESAILRLMEINQLSH